MNESTKTGLLNWRAWSTIRKAQIIGAFTGALITVAAVTLFPVASVGEFNGPNMLLFILCSFVLAPSAHFSRLLGLTGQFDRVFHASAPFICLALLVNSFLLCAVGTFVGWLANFLKSPKRTLAL